MHNIYTFGIFLGVDLSMTWRLLSTVTWSYFKFQSQSNRTAELNTLQNTIGLHLLPEIRPRCRPVPTPTAGKTLKSATARRLRRGKQIRQQRRIFRSRKQLKPTSEIWSDFTRADCLSRNSSEFTKYVNLMYLNKKIFKINWSTKFEFLWLVLHSDRI